MLIKIMLLYPHHAFTTIRTTTITHLTSASSHASYDQWSRLVYEYFVNVPNDFFAYVHAQAAPRCVQMTYNCIRHRNNEFTTELCTLFFTSHLSCNVLTTFSLTFFALTPALLFVCLLCVCEVSLLHSSAVRNNDISTSYTDTNYLFVDRIHGV